MKQAHKQANSGSEDRTSFALRLSQSLNQLMQENGIDGVSLCKATGVPSTTINRLRKRDPNINPTLSTLIPIANYFSISVDQLLGEKPLSRSRLKDKQPMAPCNLQLLPILNWEEATDWRTHLKRTTHAVTLTEHQYSEHSFALIIQAPDWENFPMGTTLLIDPCSTPLHRDFILTYRATQPQATLKQLLIDEGQRYLKPTLSGCPCSLMTPEHVILGVVVEYKKRLKN